MYITSAEGSVLGGKRVVIRKKFQRAPPPLPSYVAAATFTKFVSVYRAPMDSGPIHEKVRLSPATTRPYRLYIRPYTVCENVIDNILLLLLYMYLVDT